MTSFVGILFLTLASIVSALPVALAVWAAVDLMRSSRNRLWLIAILFVPYVGALICLLAGRLGSSPGIGGPSSERQVARRHLAALQAQLAHWRGPGLLVEAGEQRLILGQAAEAEALLREAREAAAAIDDVNFPLASAMAAQRRFADAIPLLDELLASHPQHANGVARELLATCLDESGQLDRAATELRRALQRRSPPDLQLRLANVLMRLGRVDEAVELAKEARRGIESLAPPLRRQLRAWLSIARVLEDTRAPTKLPASASKRVAGAWDRLILVVLFGLLALGLVVAILFAAIAFAPGDEEDGSSAAAAAAAVGMVEASRDDLARLNTDCPAAAWMGSPDRATLVAVAPEALDRYRRMRSQMSSSLEAWTIAQEAAKTADPEGDDGPDTVLRIAATRSTATALDDLTDVLAAEGSCPRDLAALMAVAEGQALEQDAARRLGLGEYEQYVFRRHALERDTLDAGTVALLASKQAQLSQLDAKEAAALVGLLSLPGAGTR